VKRVTSFLVLAAVVGLCFGVHATPAAAGDRRQHVVVRCSGSCDRLAAAIQAFGGEVTYRFVNVEALSARVPQGALTRLAALAGQDAIKKDTVVSLPPADGRVIALDGDTGQAVSTDVAAVVSSAPADYSFNNTLVNVAALHAQGLQGQGTIVAVIDSGVANSTAVAALSGSVIGGETLVPVSGPGADPVVSATSRYNGAHGTWVGTTIAGHALFLFSNASTLVRALQLHAPDSVTACPGPYGCSAGLSVVPVVGSAPAARLYALKVFPSTSASAPSSRITAAMDRVLTLRRNYNAGVPATPVSGDGSENSPHKYDSLKIDVVNLSLGGPTLIAGDDVQDLLTRKLVEAGVTVVVSSGNDGFGALTVGSPGSGTGAVTVAAASTATHERILREVQLAGAGLGIGTLYRPFEGLQTADFSSRGPTADGQIGPDVSANGFATFAQGTCSSTCTSAGFSLVSGTSFSAPTAAGVAAVLRSAVPDATAAQVRNAIIRSANAKAFGDKSRLIDRGFGLVDAQAALGLLQDNRARSSVPDNFPLSQVWLNVARAGYFPILFSKDRFQTRVGELLPGQVAQYFVPTDRYTGRLEITISNLTRVDPAAQNVLFGDDFLVNVLDAPTSFAVRRFEDWVVADRTIVVENPQSGLVRVAIQGDTTNAGPISGDLVITRHRSPLAKETADGALRQGDETPVRFKVPADTKELVCELFWNQDWGRYPTNDLDMVLMSPDAAAAPNLDGATLASPERVVIANPLAGEWTALVQAFAVYSAPHGRKPAREQFTLRVTADGKRVKALK